MDIESKKKKIGELQNKVNNLLRQKDDLEACCGQLKYEDYFKCEISNQNIKLSNIEIMISKLREQISELEMDVDTWSYTIMGNKEAENYWSDYLMLLLSYKTSEEYEKYPIELPEGLIKELINRCYNELVELAFQQNSRLAFQVLGVLLMESGAKMSGELNNIILKNSEWEDETHQLNNKKDIEERKRFLFDFRNKVKNYKSGIKTEVPWDSITDVFNKKKKESSSIDRRSIDYRIVR